MLTGMAELTPALSAIAATIFLMLGYTFHEARTARPLAQALTGAGWSVMAIAVSRCPPACSCAAHAADPHPQRHKTAWVRAEPWRHALMDHPLCGPGPINTHSPPPARPTASAPSPAPAVRCRARSDLGGPGRSQE